MRIGINVPNELIKRVKQIRPEVNVSQLCREMLEEHASAHERAVAQATSDGVDEQVIRLAESTLNPLLEPDWEAYAFEDARDWVRAVDLYNWEKFIDQYDNPPRNERNLRLEIGIWSRMNGTRGFADRIRENEDWLMAQYSIKSRPGDKSDPYDRAVKEYARAWLGYVNEVRRRREKHHKDEYERIMAERKEHRRSFGSPEVPPQLI